MIGCKPFAVNQRPQLVTKTPVELGSIGLLNGTALAHTFESVAIPTFEKELKLSLLAVSFSKPTFKAFAKANKQAKKVALNYADSLKIKPAYAFFQFVDRVEITTALNNSKNTGLRSYLKDKEGAQMITSISIAFSDNQINLLKKANEIFLKQSSSKKFSLLLTSVDGTEQTLELSEGVIFAYQTSGFCWKENERHKLEIADIVSGIEGCPPNTFRKADKAVTKNDYFKL
jgi:hypothetical protein